MFDILQIVFWTITYLLIIFYGIKYRQSPVLFMPLLAGSLNLAWEINAVLLQSFSIGCAVWAFLDLFIFVHNFRLLKQRKRVMYLVWLLIISFVFYFLFRVSAWNGKEVTVFTIDILMAGEFILCAKRITRHGKIPIAIAKLLGDLFAWLHYLRNSSFIAVAGLIVLLLNTLYLAICLEEQASDSRKVKHR